MKLKWAYSLVLIPFLGHAISFNELTKRASEVSEEIIESNGRANAIDFEKASALASDPLSIETSARKIKADNTNDSGTEYGFMLDYAFKLPSFQSAKSNEFDVQKKGIEYETYTRKGLLQVALKRGWLLYQLEYQRSLILSEKRDFSYQAFQIGEKKFKAGRLSQLELLRLENEYQSTLQELAAVSMEAEHAQHYLKEAVMSDQEVMVDDLNFAFISSVALEERLKKAPLLKSLDLRIDGLNAQIATLQHSKIESFSVGVGMTQEPIQNSWDVRLTIPLAISSKNENKIVALMSERSALVNVRDVIRQKLQLSVQGLFEHLKEREENIKKLADNEKKYETLFTMAHKGYEGGVIGQFEYLASKNAYYDARLRTLQMKQNYIEEMAVIEEKIGEIW